MHILNDQRVHGALASPLRRRIIRLLTERELCVCEITRVIDAPQYQVSRQLGLLKRAGLLRDWREGTWAHYELSPDLPPSLRRALAALCAWWDESAEFLADLKSLNHKECRAPGRRVGKPR